MALLPERSEIVIIGGGVVGCSIAYQLARRGKTDVTVIERRRLTEGSTWHAAGLIGQLRTSSSLTALMRSSVTTYQTLEQQTGYATGWHEVGSIRVASSDDRWHELKRLITAARSFGFDAHLISAGGGAGQVPVALHRRRARRGVGADGRLRRPEPAHAFLRDGRSGSRRPLCREHRRHRDREGWSARGRAAHDGRPDRVRHRSQRDRNVGRADSGACGVGSRRESS